MVINPGYFALHNVIFSSSSREYFQAFAQPKRNSRYSLRNSIPAYLLLMQIEIERSA